MSFARRVLVLRGNLMVSRAFAMAIGMAIITDRPWLAAGLILVGSVVQVLVDDRSERERSAA